jgi:hypothetical protein
MTLKISVSGNGYKVAAQAPGTGWRGFSVQAQDIGELHQAIDHHFMAVGAFKTHAGKKENCPFCRLMRAEQKRAAKSIVRRITKHFGG